MQLTFLFLSPNLLNMLYNPVILSPVPLDPALTHMSPLILSPVPYDHLPILTPTPISSIMSPTLSPIGP